jgi:hypothetical protein
MGRGINRDPVSSGERKRIGQILSSGGFRFDLGLIFLALPSLRDSFQFIG